MTKFFVNSTYPSIEWGNVELLDKSKKVTVRFLNTGNIRVFTTSALSSGKMTDMEEKKRLREEAVILEREEYRLGKPGRRTDSWIGRTKEVGRWGEVTCLYSNRHKVMVRFERTGNEYEVFKTAYELGNIGDSVERARLIKQRESDKVKEKISKLYNRSVHGVGYIGEGPNKSGKTMEGVLWRGMLRRCYENGTGQKGYEDCSVDDRWHCFQTFCEDIKLLPGYDLWVKNEKGEGGRNLYQLDKDVAFIGNKVYCPDFCQFLTQKENLEFAVAKPFSFKKGEEVVTGTNLAQWCRDNGKQYSYMNQMITGIVPQAYGYTKT